MKFVSTPYTRISPVNRSITWQGDWANQELCDLAFEKARSAQAKWRSTSIDDRISVLKRFASLLQSNSESIAMAITLDSGKPFWESLTEIQSSIAKVDNAIDAIRTRQARRRSDIVRWESYWSSDRTIFHSIFLVHISSLPF
jgi:succinylglutamic semialdehyde dehydrogenase